MFAQNIDCGILLKPPRQDGSNKNPQPMFRIKNKKKPQFYYFKVEYEGVYIR